MTDDAKKLSDGVKALGFEISESQSAALLAYLDHIDLTNRSMNLTRIPREEYVTLHLLDSLTALLAIPKRERLSIIDVGTGAGFPGVPLAVLLPHAQVSLLDSTMKKVNFAASTAQMCGISNCHGIHARAEQLSKTGKHRNGYDVVVSRAVAAFPKLMEWLLPLAKPGGVVIALKGSGYEDELRDSAKVLKQLHGAIDRIIPVQLPGTQIARYLIVVSKGTAKR